MNMAVWEDPASSTMPYCRGKAAGQAWRLKAPWLLQPFPRESTGAECTTTPTLSVPSSSGASSGRGRLCSAQPGTAKPTPAQTGHCLECDWE